MFNVFRYTVASSPRLVVFVFLLVLGCACGNGDFSESCTDEISLLQGTLRPHSPRTAQFVEQETADDVYLLQAGQEFRTVAPALKTPKKDLQSSVERGSLSHHTPTGRQSIQKEFAFMGGGSLTNDMRIDRQTFQHELALIGDITVVTNSQELLQNIREGRSSTVWIAAAFVLVLAAWFLVPSASNVDGDKRVKADGMPLSSDSEDEPSEPISAFRWGMMSLMIYIYALINTSMALFVLPVESRRMHPGSGGSFWVALCIGVSGAAQLINPLAGKLSDRHVSPLGRRRPFVLLGTGVAVAGTLGLWQASLHSMPVAYLVMLFCVQIGLNLAFSAQCGLPSDVQDERFAGQFEEEISEDQLAARGTSSAVMALLSMLGSLSAVAIMAMTRHTDVQSQYPLYIIGLVLCCAAVCKFAPEQPSHASAQPQAITWMEVKGGFTINIDEDEDFFWVCLGRMFYYCVTSTLVFQMYYLEDMLEMVDEVDRKLSIFIMVVIGQLIGLVCSLPFGALSNTLGRKKLIYGACVIMSLATLCQMVAPKMGTHGSWPVVLVSAALAGLGNSAYLSVDYALALDCMPTGKTTAEAFGLWGIAGFAGSTIGPILGAVLLHLTAAASRGWGGHTHYTYVGYASLLFVLGIVGNVFVTVCTCKIALAN